MTEVYVYGGSGDEYTQVISEVENIGPGTSRDMDVDLSGGTYQIACKPGQTGDGIRQTITVASDSSQADNPTDDAAVAYDRELELAIAGTTIEGLSEGATVGEVIELKLLNTTGGPRTLEVKNPAGQAVSEVEDIQPEATGELIVEFDIPGDWLVIVEGDDVDEVAASLSVS